MPVELASLPTDQALHVPGVSAEQFKLAMRHLGGTANVITVEHQGQRSGLTATSVTSVAADPAEVLVCVNQSSSSWPLMRDSGLFGVNILGVEQAGMALQFAGFKGEQGDARYAGHDWLRTEHGIWLARQAPAALACQIVEVIERHSHALVLGRVLQVHHAEQAQDSPLLYWQGRFGRFQGQ
ncbi:MAG: flavin reductase family protein [Alcaligenes nematophilus]|uniref:flavin reductase family protein n=1 Tax=Alcaligenes nematophilus TaxID=2994643 RepID=UPI003CFED68B